MPSELRDMKAFPYHAGAHDLTQACVCCREVFVRGLSLLRLQCLHIVHMSCKPHMPGSAAPNATCKWLPHSSQGPCYMIRTLSLRQAILFLFKHICGLSRATIVLRPFRSG